MGVRIGGRIGPVSASYRIGGRRSSGYRRNFDLNPGRPLTWLDLGVGAGLLVLLGLIGAFPQLIIIIPAVLIGVPLVIFLLCLPVAVIGYIWGKITGDIE